MSSDTLVIATPQLAKETPPSTSLRSPDTSMEVDAAETRSPSTEPLPQDALVIDVGGGVGPLSVKLALAHTHLRFLVQDRAQAVALAPAVWGDKHKGIFDSNRVSFQAQDFFDPQPSQNTSVFLLSRVLRNWSDAACKKCVL